MPAGSSVLGTGAARAGHGHRAHPGGRGLMSPWEMGSASSQGGVLGLLGQGTPLLTGIIRGTSLALLGWQHCLLRVSLAGLGQLPITAIPLLLLEPLPTPLFGCVPPGLADRDP